MEYKSVRGRYPPLSIFRPDDDDDSDLSLPQLVRRERLRMKKDRISRDGVNIFTEREKSFLEEAIRKYEVAPSSSTEEDGGFSKLFRLPPKVQDDDVADSPSSDSDSDPEDVNTVHMSKGQSGTWRKSRSKLWGLFDTQTGLGLEGNFRSKLMAACETDLGIIYGCVNFSAGVTKNFLVEQKPPAQSVELQKVSNLHFMLTRVGFFETVMWDAMLKALVDLCRLDNDIILYRSLRVLHRALSDVCPMVSGSNTRVEDNVKVEGSSSEKNTEKTLCLQSDEFSRRIRNALPESGPDWIAVFELMSQIVTRKIEECTKLEAISIMNLLLQSSNAYGGDRERVLGYQTIIQLLDKESGVDLQKEAVKLLFLLLNCPELKSIFLSACKNVFENAKEATKANAVDAQEIGDILNGLSGLVSSRGKSTAELKLRMEAMKLWAVLVTSGELEFEVFVPYLELILQMLVSEVDAVDLCICEQPEVFKERTLLIRWILIHINQLLSHPRDEQISLMHVICGKVSSGFDVDIAGMLSRDNACNSQSDELTRRMRETVVELTRIFEKLGISLKDDCLSFV